MTDAQSKIAAVTATLTNDPAHYARAALIAQAQLWAAINSLETLTAGKGGWPDYTGDNVEEVIGGLADINPSDDAVQSVVNVARGGQR